MRRVLIMALAFTLTAPSAWAQPQPQLPAPVREIADEFLGQLKSNQPSEAIRSAFRDTAPLLGSTVVDNLIGGVTNALRTLGPLQEWSIYRTNEIAPGFIEVTYFVKTANVPAFATFQFYNPGERWRVIDFRLNTYINARNSGYAGPKLPN